MSARALGITAVLLLALLPTGASAAVGAPKLMTPANAAHMSALGTFTWSKVSSAEHYEFELAADERFGSIVGGSGAGSFSTRNLAATLTKSIPDGSYFWRVRAITARGTAGKWSEVRSLQKAWTEKPVLTAPEYDSTVTWPASSLVMRWTPVAGATRYEIVIATDSALASPVYKEPLRTTGTVAALPATLPAGTYYWGITPFDAEEHRGTRSAVGSFKWVWPSTVSILPVQDLNADPRVFDPQFAWALVPGAARYEVEVNKSEDFASGSKVCCSDPTTGTSLSPTAILENNRYYWRVRALDADSNAGGWVYGPQFDKTFDAVVPTIPSLQVRDHTGAVVTGQSTGAPIVKWDPVPGASSYEVRVQPEDTGCGSFPKPSSQGETTLNTAWAPNAGPPDHFGPAEWPSGKGGVALATGAYCVWVLARSGGGAAESEWTQVNGAGNRAFTLSSPPVPAGPAVAAMPEANYREPAHGSTTPRMPLFTWDPTPGAVGYWVVVSKDASFTNPVDVNYTKIPAYAPKEAAKGGAYPDETTSYYWVAIPDTAGAAGGFTTAAENHPRAFQKRSTPPELLSPVGGVDVPLQPTFRWGSAEGARDYRLQVAQDPTFSNPLDDVKTASTAYTSSATYPADALLYWRVRATTEGDVGLTWSPTQTFRRALPAPVPAATSPQEGEAIPLLSWDLVPGAVAYETQVDQPDGSKKEFTLESAAFTPSEHYGTGIWRWRVRALFPNANGSGTTPGPYSGFVPFARRIKAPTGARGIFSGGRMLIGWDAQQTAKRYRIEVSETSSFSGTIEATETDIAVWAPRFDNDAYRKGGTLYFRVATIDQGGNQGAWTTGTFTLPRALRVSSPGEIARRPVKKFTLKVTDARGRVVKGVRVRLSGAPLRRAVARRTDKRGKVTFKIAFRRKGTVKILATRKGFVSAAGKFRVG